MSVLNTAPGWAGQDCCARGGVHGPESPTPSDIVKLSKECLTMSPPTVNDALHG